VFADEKDIKNDAVEADAEKTPAKKPAAKKPAAEKAPAEKKAPAKKPGAKKPAAKKPAAKPAAKADDKAEAKTDDKAEAKSDDKAEATKKAPAKKAPAKKPAAKKAPAKEVNVEPTLVKATARYVRIAPRKARLVVDHVRGESVEDARLFLQFTARHAGRDIAKVLESAVANAEHNHELSGDDLHVVKAYVDEGPTLKRWRPRAKGRATQILKRTSHITVVVSDVPSKEISRKAAA
jgi:ribosomal protein L22